MTTLEQKAREILKSWNNSKTVTTELKDIFQEKYPNLVKLCEESEITIEVFQLKNSKINYPKNFLKFQHKEKEMNLCFEKKENAIYENDDENQMPKSWNPFLLIYPFNMPFNNYSLLNYTDEDFLFDSSVALGFEYLSEERFIIILAEYFFKI